MLAYSRWDEQNSHVVVVVNFSERSLNQYKISNFPITKNWRDWVGNREVKSGEDGLVTDLPSYTAKIFILQT
ncbi:alpha amylase C-terminal domain-containing protein [Nostoc sp.]|uniref:alpha amylase C-terminal domain-containing protein n=1 Tax=Nostoc sp. TaxID=1180 RepID=UPI003FA58C98